MPIDLVAAGIAAGVQGAGEALPAVVQGVFNARQAKLNREFQERMSNTSLQRQMADAKKAGVNPLFALGKAGATTPAGSTAAGIDAPHIGGFIDKIYARKMQKKQIRQIEKAIDTQDSVINSNNASAARAYMQMRSESQNYETLKSLQKAHEAQARHENARADSEIYRQPEMRAYADMYNSKIGKWIPYYKLINPLVGGTILGGGIMRGMRRALTRKPTIKLRSTGE